MIKLNVEEYCHQCLDFTPDVIRSSRENNDDDQTQSDMLVQCKYRKRCANIKRYLEHQGRDEVVG